MMWVILLNRYSPMLTVIKKGYPDNLRLFKRIKNKIAGVNDSVVRDARTGMPNLSCLAETTSSNRGSGRNTSPQLGLYRR